MKEVYITEISGYPQKSGEGFVLDLAQTVPQDCIGCWRCWIKTPGRCVHHDLDAFYQAFLNADRAVFYIHASLGFVSGNLKTLFDRMIPHSLPYIRYNSGESMHEPRYDKYPDVVIYYTGDFVAEERQLFEEYLARVFYQFHMQASIRPLTQTGEAQL